jgi:hypothetical protein
MDGISVVVAVAGGWLTADALSFVTGGVFESSEVVVGGVASVGRSAVVDVGEALVSAEAGGADVVDVEEVSGGTGFADVEAPSTAGVDVELTNGGAFSMYVPFGHCIIADLKVTALRVVKISTC